LGLTSPYMCFICEQITVVLPFAPIAVHRPALADLGDGEAVEEFGGGSVDVGVGLGLDLVWRSHLAELVRVLEVW